jgi:hypothetical protein
MSVPRQVPAPGSRLSWSTCMLVAAGLGLLLLMISVVM